MEWKEFLKPDWIKIGLLPFLFIINFIFFYIFLSCAGGPTCSECQENYECYKDLFFFYGISSGGECWIGCYPKNLVTFYNITNNFLLIVILFILPYLFSCLIVWIYDKVKKR
jgi:hypothetical protein